MAFRTWDAYFIPGTQVLKNKLGASDKAQLEQVENDASYVRLSGLLKSPTPASFDLSTFQQFHERIFQDVYEWAGEIRQVPENGQMVKSYSDVVNFAPGDPDAPSRNYHYFPVSHMNIALNYTFDQLKQSNWLQGLSEEEFVPRLAEVWGDVNSIHPFREGNTRTQIAFFSALADNAGHHLDTSQLHWDSPTREEFIAARFHNVATADSSRLANVIGSMMSPNETNERSLQGFVSSLKASFDLDSSIDNTTDQELADAMSYGNEAYTGDSLSAALSEQGEHSGLDAYDDSPVADVDKGNDYGFDR